MAELDSGFAKVCLVDAFVYGRPSLNLIGEGLLIFLIFCVKSINIAGDLP